jgi:hypothetical protein
MIGKKGKWRQQPEMEGWKNTKIKQGKKEGLRGGMIMKRLPSKDVKRKSRKNEHFQIFKFLIFGGFHLCPLPDANALAAIHKTHKTQDASLQCRPTHTHTIIFLGIGSIGWGRERQVLRVFLAFYFQAPKLEREHGLADR